MTTNKGPQIRFKGFSGEWEEKVLIDIANFINEKILLNELTLSNYISTENLLQNFRGVLISSKLPNSKTVTQFKTNDILISNIRPYLKKVWSATFNGGASNDILVVRAKEDIKNNFLTYFLKNEKFINYMMEGTKGVKMPRGDISLIKIYPLFISLNSNEQTKIGNYFQNLDKLIEQKEKKHKKLEQLKKAMLEKMFPKDGEDTPEIRFKGFSGEWEENNLGNIAIITIGEFMIKTKQNPNSLYPVYNGGKSNTGFYNEFNNEGNKIIISARGANAGYVNFEMRRYWAGNSCYSISMLDDNLFMIKYFYYWVKKNERRFKDNQQSANIPSVSKDDVIKFKVSYPKIDEQTKIGNYFQKLDKLIDLQLQELEKLKNIKKASLDKMFV